MKPTMQAMTTPAMGPPASVSAKPDPLEEELLQPLTCVAFTPDKAGLLCSALEMAEAAEAEHATGVMAANEVPDTV
jgi:hypothetical protein